MKERALVQRMAASLALGVVALVSTSCGEVARSGRSPVTLVIDALEAASGASPDEFGSVAQSDVQTLVTQQVNGQPVRVPTIYNDLARATFRLVLKNPGTTASPTSPSLLNEVTLTRYRVSFRRSDGRNTQGVDVPYSFDGAITVTVRDNATSVSFDLVRHQHKREPPLRNLINGGAAQFISTIAEITFWGHDVAGNEVSAVGNISVNFGDFADPQ